MWFATGVVHGQTGRNPKVRVADDPGVGSRTARTGAPARYSPTLSLSCDCVWISQLNGQPETGEEVCLTSRARIKPLAVVDRSTLFAPGAGNAVHRGRFWTTASYAFA